MMQQFLLVAKSCHYITLEIDTKPKFCSVFLISRRFKLHSLVDYYHDCVNNNLNSKSCDSRFHKLQLFETSLWVDSSSFLPTFADLDISTSLFRLGFEKSIKLYFLSCSIIIIQNKNIISSCILGLNLQIRLLIRSSPFLTHCLF